MSHIDPECAVVGCARPAKTHGWCGMHAERVRTRGTTDLAPRETLEERFWSKVEKTETCWLWTASTADKRGGYGRFGIGGQMKPAHRVAYELLVGEIPTGLVLDHLCRVPACVNPDHLEPVTIAENSLRGASPLVTAWRRNECTSGHSLTPENTYVRPNGRRECRTCATTRRRGIVA